ncbi:MAG: pitrilysin family protein, partial [Rhodospirillales bacterium]
MSAIMNLARTRLAPALLTLALTLFAVEARAIDIQQVTSPGGLTAWLVRDSSVPIISVSYAFKGGTALEPADKAGVTRLMTGLLDEGAGPYSGAQFHSKLDDLAVRFSIDAGLDNIAGSLRTLSQHREAAFDLLRLALAEPHFDVDAVERVRAQMQSIIRDEESDPATIASRTLTRTIFAGHPYAQPRNGTAQTMAAITTQDIRDVYRKLLVRDRLVIAVVGDIDAVELARLLDRAFGGLPVSNASIDLPPWPSADTPAPPGRVIVIDRDIPQSVASFAEPGLKRDDPDWFAAFVMNYILGGGSFSSRLLAEVREKRGLAYSLGTGLSPYRSGGLIYGSVGTANAKVAQSIELIRSEWALLAEKGVTEKELADAKTYLTGSFPLSLDSTASVASLLLTMQLENLGIDYLSRRDALIRNVTAADIQRVATRLL